MIRDDDAEASSIPSSPPSIQVHATLPRISRLSPRRSSTGAILQSVPVGIAGSVSVTPSITIGGSPYSLGQMVVAAEEQLVIFRQLAQRIKKNVPISIRDSVFHLCDSQAVDFKKDYERVETGNPSTFHRISEDALEVIQNLELLLGELESATCLACHLQNCEHYLQLEIDRLRPPLKLVTMQSQGRMSIRQISSINLKASLLG